MAEYSCPDCGHSGPFSVIGTATLSVDHEGYVDDADYYWDGDSEMTCPECDYQDMAHEFAGASPRRLRTEPVLSEEQRNDLSFLDVQVQFNPDALAEADAS